jgi:hypothetical protein
MLLYLLYTFTHTIMSFMKKCIKKFKSRVDGLFEARRRSDTEHCVICKDDTQVPKTLDINDRSLYIEGVGQLCYDCYERVSHLYTGDIQ